MADRYITSAKEERQFRNDLEGLSERTVTDYKKLAANFYSKRLGGEAPTPKRIADALRQAAGDYRPGSWRKLRNALMYDQIDKGYFEAAQRLKETKNPVTTGKTKTPVKPKQKRVKSVSDKDWGMLIKAANELEDKQVAAALLIAHDTGCRPAEMLGIERVGDNQLHITGAKKTEDGIRGLDRTITLSPEKCEVVAKAVELLNLKQVGGKDGEGVKPFLSTFEHRMQSALDRLTRSVWPRKKARPTLYSLRHQMGSDLKASGLSRREIAYLMGHQSTQSVEVYGDRRTARAGKSPIKPAPDANLSAVRENHTQAPGENAPGANKRDFGGGDYDM